MNIFKRKKTITSKSRPKEEPVFNGFFRINKRLKDLGLSGRREADELIKNKKVLINGHIAKLGDKVKEHDEIKILQPQNYLYYSFNKPKNVVSHSAQYGEKEVKDFFPNWEKDNLTLVGRLDKLSEGLMLITNDKRIVDRLLNPEYDHEKTYEVVVQEKISTNIIRLFAKGFQIKNRFKAKPAKVEIINNFKFRITLTEGKKHQIRLMLNDLHYTVFSLKRISILNLNLKSLGPGEYKEIKKEEVKKLLNLLSLK